MQNVLPKNPALCIEQGYYPPLLIAQLAHIGRIAKQYDFNLSTLSTWQLSAAVVSYTSGKWLDTLLNFLNQTPDVSKIAADKDSPRKAQRQFIALIKAAEQTLDRNPSTFPHSYLIAECETDDCKLSRHKNPAIRAHLLDVITPTKPKITITFFGSGRLLQELLILQNLHTRGVSVSHIVLIDMIYGPMHAELVACDLQASTTAFSRLLYRESIRTLIQQFRICLSDMYGEHNPKLSVYSRASDYLNSTEKMDFIVGADFPNKEYTWSWGEFHEVCKKRLAQDGTSVLLTKSGSSIYLYEGRKEQDEHVEKCSQWDFEKTCFI